MLWVCGICVLISFWPASRLMSCARLQPKAGAICNEETLEVPLVKWAGPKVPRSKELQELNQVDVDVDSVGYAAAVDNRSKAMETKGLQTSLPTLTKEQRKLDKERKKALSNAKHLLK